jgi:uncharacterized paraquat-inducible protein A
MRLIDADALIEQLFDKRERYADGHSVYEDAVYIGIGKAVISANMAPTVDAVEVVHGRWVLQRYYGGVRKGMVARVICSECGYPNEKTNYCPQCGTKMDGGEEDG